MLPDLKDEGIQPIKINMEFLPDVSLSKSMRKKLETMLKEEENNYASIHEKNGVVKIVDNYVLFSNQWFYLAAICKKFALNLYEYCNFLDKNIRNNSELTKCFINEEFDNLTLENIFDNKTDIHNMYNFMIGGDFRPGKSLINGAALRPSKDVFGSCILSKFDIPNASSDYLGNIIYYLAKRPDLYMELEKELVMQISNDKKEVLLPQQIKYCAKKIIDCIYEIDKFKRIEEILEVNEKNIKINVKLLDDINISGNCLRYLFAIKDMSGLYEPSENTKTRVFTDTSYEVKGVKDCRLTTEWVDSELVPDADGNYLKALIEVVNKRYAKILEIIEKNGQRFLVYRYVPEYKKNRIVFGAPGTGKSFKLQENVDACIKDFEGKYERVTFHPDYTYSHFVGTYKPVSENGNIIYKFVPGPFLRVYVEALKNIRTPHILLIEEINRARVAAVFGDVFQLLDRDSDGSSVYPIQTSEDVRKYLAEQLHESEDNYKEMRLPNNMFIWATMNSADQGVFPIDTAFKRRWNFEYINIDDAEEKLPKIEIPIGNTNDQYSWNDLRKAINNNLIANGINEDKLLGPFFLNEKAQTDKKDFNENFKNKVIMYLFEDVMRMHPNKLFNNNNGDMKFIYSDICKKFDSDGINIFNEKIVEELRHLKKEQNNILNQSGVQATSTVANNNQGGTSN